jgi:uncharacterized protein YlbG (UPF0298 family)
MGKDEVKLSLFASDIILYLKDNKVFTKKLLDLINTFGNVAGYKTNKQKSVAFLYTNNEQVEEEIRKIIHNSLKNKIPRDKPNYRAERPLKQKLQSSKE